MNDYKKKVQQYEMIIKNKEAVFKTGISLLYPIIIIVLLCYIFFSLFSNFSNTLNTMNTFSNNKQMKNHMLSSTLL